VAKVGRNDPCPCGSGKKYKKCCLGKAEQGLKRDHLWNPAEIAPVSTQDVLTRLRSFEAEIAAMSTQDILTRLRSFGIDITEKEFLAEVNNFHSASDLAKSWRNKYGITATGFDEDFPWMASMVLWERLAPGLMNDERLGEMMDRGDALIGEGRYAEGCDICLEAWGHLKKRFTPEMDSIAEAESVFDGLELLSDWCDDLALELGNAGLDNAEYHHKRIAYCREFCSLFPASDPDTIQLMKRSVSESYFALGMTEEGEKSFQAPAQEFPENA